MSKKLFENITDDEYKILETVLHRPHSKPADFFLYDPTVDGRIQELEKYKLLISDCDGLTISELGRSALVEHDKMTKQKQSAEVQRKEELASLKTIADSAIKQANSAESIALFAKEQAGSAMQQADTAKSIAQSSAEQILIAINQTETIKSIADSTKQQAELAIQQAQKADNTSLLAKITANKSFILSIVSICFTILINADKIVQNTRKILSYLNTLIH